MVKTNIQTFTGEVEILSNLHVGPSGSSYLTANGAASNVLDITGNVGATFFVGDGGFLSNIATTLSDIVNQGNVSANVLQFNSTSDYAGVGLVTSSNVGIQNTAPSHTLSIGDKIRVDDNTVESSGQSVIQVDGRILATRFQGDGGLLSNIATTFESIVNQGNVASNVVKFSSDSGYGGAGLVTDSNVGIQNTAPTHNLSVGSNLHVNDTGSNVLTVHGNVVASNLNLGIFSLQPAYGLNEVCNTSNGTSNVVQFQNTTTSLIASSNIVVSGNVTTQSLISTSNTEVGDRLKFSGSNVFVDTLRVSDVASNIVTYDQVTGELTDSGGSFMNKFTMVSEQPPSNIFSNVSNGPYTLTTSNLATNSNTFNAFDGTANAWVSGNLQSSYYGGSNVFHENNLTQLSNTHPTQFGDWLAIEFPYKSRLRHMKLTPLTAAQFPASANIYATNDSVTWTEIGYWKDRNPVTNSNVQTISVNTSEDFNKYALVATKAAGNSSNVAIQDWNLFTESISIDGGKGVDKRRAATKTFVFTVSNASGANKYYINGVQQSSLQLEQNHTYIFDVSSTTLSGHPLRFSTTATGSEYTTGITNLGTYGGGGTATRTFAVSADSPATLYYFCTAHAGMGATMSISPTAELEVSGRIMSRDLVATGGTTSQRPTYAPPGTIRYNSTTGFMEAYSAVGWAPIAQPPTVTGISPLTTLQDGSASRTLAHQYNIVTPDGGGGFGTSVAMSTDGTYAIVGANLDEEGGAPTNSGSAHIFVKNGNTWTHEQKLVHPSPAASDFMGKSVAISGDGTYAVVGAFYDDTTTPATDAGSVQVFWRHASAGWIHVDELTMPSPQYNHQFGISVAISGDATYIVVGVYLDDQGQSDTGSVQVYRKTSANGINSQWNHEQNITSSATFTPTATDWFGYSVSISLDGYYIICGSPFREGSVGDREGKAVVFKRASGATSFTFQQTLTHPTPQTSDEFGRSVSLSSDGTYALIGVPGDGSGGSYANGAGTGQVFVRNGTTWTHQAELAHPSPGAAGVTMAFGWSVSISGDGVYALIGTWEADVNGVSKAGSAQIFKRVGTSWTHQAQVLRPTPTASNYAFTSVAMSSDGAYAIANGGGPTATRSVEIFYNSPAPDTSTQVFTATGTGIVSGSTVQLEGADGTLYSVSNVTTNTAGTQATFKMQPSGSSSGTVYPDIDMTSASQGGYVVTAHTEGSGSEAMWKAFDGNSSSTYWKVDNGYSTSSPYSAVAISGVLPSFTDTAGTPHVGHWIQLELPKKIKLTRFVTAANFASSYFMNSYVVLGSNDNTSWTLLHSEANGTGVQDVTTLSGGSTSYFKYFKLLVKSKLNAGNAHLQVGEVEYYGILDDGRFDVAQQPYKVRINSTSGLSGTSTAKIGFPVTWTTAADANLNFDIARSQTQTLVGTDGGGGTNRTFSVAPGSNALPSDLTLTGSTGAITGQIAAVGTTSVTFRLTDNATGLFTDRAINIVGDAALYTWSPNPFTFGAARLNGGGAPPETTHGDTLYGATLQNYIDKGTYSSAAWRTNTAYFKLGASGVDSAENGFQLWTVPITGTYTIKAYGASGGGLESAATASGASSPTEITYGGYGAWTQGNFNLTKGEKVLIIVGHVGRCGFVSGVTSAASGGGGGTYVLKELGASSAISNASIYCIAGGGGGGRQYDQTSSGHTPNRVPGDGIASQAAEITSGGGGSGSANYGSGGGAGYFANGNVPTSTTSGFEAQRPYIGSQGGYGSWSWGSSSVYGNRYGGFGGGGGNGAHDPGSGGGYQGGGGSGFGYNYAQVSQGGTSRNNGIAGTISFGNSTETEANGKVIITLI